MPSIVTAIEPPPEEVARVIHAGLVDFNAPWVDAAPTLRFAVWAADDGGARVGGLEAALRWGWLRIDSFWLPPALRGRGLGRTMLHEAEAFARARGCVASYLDTFEFQARGFYERLGYRVFGVQEGFPPGSRRYFPQKSLVGAGDPAA